MSGEVDVAIVGAGPAGCATAITLARTGARVLLVDRARFPRDKCCGDGLTTAAVRRLDALGLDPGDVASFRPARELAVRSPSGRTVLLPLAHGPGVFAA
ncbi:MAG: FAD-dependent oxidoreductase, partial [Acidimicrobiales bacterium]